MGVIIEIERLCGANYLSRESLLYIYLYCTWLNYVSRKTLLNQSSLIEKKTLVVLPLQKSFQLMQNPNGFGLIILFNGI